MALRIKANIPPRKPSVTPQPAARHFDIVLGLDFHFIKIPPTVIPCPVVPFAAMVFDPMDYLHMTLPVMPVYSNEGGFSLQTNIPVGGTVTINGCYRAAATTSVLSLPPMAAPLPGKFKQMANLAKKFNPLHAIIPRPVFVFPNMAPHDGQLSHGSETVHTAGSEQSALFCRAFSCADIGRFVPNMPAGLFNNYATAVIAVLPFGKPVLVGGPFVEHAFTPADLINSLMMMGMMRGAGKLLSKTLGKLLTKMNRALMEKFPAYRAHGAAVQPHICHYLGEPVDAASGHMASLLQGFTLPGPIPFVWEANYYSDSEYEGPLGKSIYHSYDITLQMLEAEELVILRDQYGCAVPFAWLAPGDSFFNPRDKYTLHRSMDGIYTVTGNTGICYAFNHFAGSDGYHKLRSINDRNGFIIRFNYNIRGQLVKITDSTHRELIVVNDDHGRITAIRLPHAELPGEYTDTVRYSFSSENQLLSFYDARGNYNSLQWHNRLVTARRFRDGTIFRFTYNSSGQCTAALGPDGIYSYRFAYTAGCTIVSNSLGHRSGYYHRDGLVTRIVNSQGAETIYRYDSNRNLLGVQDELGRVKNYRYDERGNTTGIGLPGQGHAGIAYNSHNLPVQVTQPNGGVWQYVYDEQGNLLEEINPAGGTIRYAYTCGQVTAITNTAGHTTQLRYNRQYALSEVVLSANARIRYRYDAIGRCTQLEDIYGNHQFRKYDGNNNLVEVREADGNIRHLQYDAMDNLVAAADKLYKASLEYNFFGNVTRRRQGAASVTFIYDREGQLTGISNEHNEQYHFVRDSEGRVLAETGFDGVTRHYRRNAAGQVITMQCAGNRSTQYEYDTAGRITQVMYADGLTETFEYDNLGNLVKANNDACSVAMERDLLGRVTAETILVKDQQPVVLQHTRDAAGNRTALNSSLGATIQVSYNSRGYAASLQAGGWQSELQHNDTGDEIHRALTGGIEQQWRYDRFGRPLEQQVLHGKTTRRRLQYNWGVSDRLLSVSDTQTGSVQFKHDVYGNLSELVYGDGKTECRLPDVAGNLFETSTQTDRKYGAGGRLLKAKGCHYHYDAAGNLARKEEANGGIWQYLWNDNGSLQQVIRPDGYKVSFGYDALGRRIWKRYRQTTTRWIWDGNTPLHEWKTFDARESTPDDLITWVFEAGNFVPAARLKGDKKYSIIANHLGTPEEIYREDGTCCWQGRLDSYGRMRMQQGEPGSCPFRYQGQYEDSETGLYYNRFRYYSPAEGIYISQDPIGLSGGMRLYGYVTDPCTWVDVLGLIGFTPDQQALINLAMEASNKGKLPISSGDADILLQWGQEVNLNATMEVKILNHKFSSGNNPAPGHFAHEGSDGHIHIHNKHIPCQ
ncbi:RHS repeat-associated core domain-containing protein [Deminuibacter soli]|uniref:Type IV secretion protein Rhs n=1 Tax=Deminuibacter soli TaxID=2291815 RepID=A0A3E1NQB5_9BACT|nr:RHS repeat-associated core domain-containing protein [Deminuibacter soli]RFM30122.1 hypothetical protein DXN05_03875 [Deminuibacter soli]